MDDLKDIEGQLKAIDDWMGVLEERLRQQHACMGSKELRLARGYVRAVIEQVVREKERIVEECKKLPD